MKEKVLSVGIDIGTSTTEIVFSHIVVDNIAASFRIPDIQIVDKEIIYRSPVYFTPLLSDTLLDTDRIMNIVRQEYSQAGIHPENVGTGAVIITGDTARKENAEAVLEWISDYAGDFVVATAGPQLESILAGKGSGASEYSRAHTGTILNLDIGGGTTNTALFENGVALEASCYDIGGRLIRHDPNGNVEYLFPKFKPLFRIVKDLLNDPRNESLATIEMITEILAQGIIEIIDPQKRSPLERFLATNEKMKPHSVCPDAVSFSGGVGDLIYQEQLPEMGAYGDIGVLLARKIRDRLKESQINLVKPQETIGATVVGAGNHSVDISGSTVTLGAIDHLPLLNIPILRIDNPNKYDGNTLKNKLKEEIGWIQSGDPSVNIALAIESEDEFSFEEIQKMAKKILIGMESLLDSQDVLIVVLKVDYAKVLGQSIRRLLPEGKQLICLDGINVGNGDYIDIGKPVGVGEAVPVVLKTIAFSY